jgi:hypothetical protein
MHSHAMPHNCLDEGLCERIPGVTVDFDILKLSTAGPIWDIFRQGRR